MNMEPTLSLLLIEQNVNLRAWADGKAVGRAQNAIHVILKLKDSHLYYASDDTFPNHRLVHVNSDKVSNSNWSL